MNTISALQDQVVVPSNTVAEDTSERDEIEEQKIEFLNLLITQLQNQNPLDPMDTKEYTNQLIQYSQLEQQLEMKDGVNTLNTSLMGQNSIMALSYIGETVELTTNAAPVQDGTATWNYIVQGTADELKLQVLDADKNLIEEIDGNKNSGVHQFEFDAAAEGIDDGSAVFLQVVAKDSDGETLPTGMTSFAKVDGVTGDGQTPYMTAGSLSFGLQDILKVSQEQVAAAVSTP